MGKDANGMEAGDGSALLSDLIDQAKGLPYGEEAARDRLIKRTEMILRRLDADAKYLADLENIRFHPMIGGASSDYKISSWESGRDEVVNLLTTALEEFETFGGGAIAPKKASSSATNPVSQGRDVFLVHGHDVGLKQTVARTLERLELKPIILHEQPNEGRTIIEKFEDYSDVSFAVVLLTPDDMGYESDKDSETARPRARQNVILELGFFLGKLGRDHVAALYNGDKGFETPSDYDGVLYIPVDEHGHWKFGLVKELKAAGIEVDANLLT